MVKDLLHYGFYKHLSPVNVGTDGERQKGAVCQFVYIKLYRVEPSLMI